MLFASSPFIEVLGISWQYRSQLLDSPFATKEFEML